MSISLNQSPNLIFTQPYCPYCVKAKILLEEKGIEMMTLVLGQDLEKQAMVEFVEQEANVTVRTVPQIFLSGKYIGGHDDLVAHFERQAAAADLGDLDFDL
jgi:glutaredoxin 3